ncbi:hypothetical protein WK55_31425 [Burkholderia ubonensis]|nr:hypothetical protein WK55_31425 [Burkholderia ubonensis]
MANAHEEIADRLDYSPKVNICNGMLIIFLTLKSKSSTFHFTMLEKVQHLTLVLVSCLDKLCHRCLQQ